MCNTDLLDLNILYVKNLIQFRLCTNYYQLSLFIRNILLIKQCIFAMIFTFTTFKKY